jgi:DNA-binding response OmpR family regulator
MFDGAQSRSEQLHIVSACVPEDSMLDQTQHHQHTVLCVDANRESTDQYARWLGQEYQLTTAATALDALRLSNERSFDAFIMEFWLPDWTGLSLCRHTRAVDPHAPVIFCTTARKETDRDRAARAGASAYLVKPLERPLLLSQLRDLLAVASARAACARVVAERELQAELQRRVNAFREGVSTALGGAERAARKKALAAFTQAGGTQAMFYRTWPEMLINGQAAAGYVSSHDDTAASISMTAERLMGSHPAGSLGNGRRSAS